MEFTVRKVDLSTLPLHQKGLQSYLERHAPHINPAVIREVLNQSRTCLVVAMSADDIQGLAVGTVAQSLTDKALTLSSVVITTRYQVQCFAALFVQLRTYAESHRCTKIEFDSIATFSPVVSQAGFVNEKEHYVFRLQHLP